MARVLPEAWEEWYRFASEELEYEHDEAVEYATARYVEDENHGLPVAFTPLRLSTTAWWPCRCIG